jgi:hypothetical protein
MTLQEFKNKYLNKKSYLGDGLFVHHDGCYFILSTKREEEEHYVGLEEDVFDTLIEYRAKFYQDYKTITKGTE